MARLSKSAFAQSKTCIALSYLHHLFLIEHDAMGRSQNICDGIIQQVNTFLAVLTLDEVIRIITGTGTIETGGRYQSSKRLGFTRLRRLMAPGCSNWKMPGLACGKEFKVSPYLPSQCLQSPSQCHIFQRQLLSSLGKGQITQAQEVHLEQTIGLNSMGIILGNQHILPCLSGMTSVKSLSLITTPAAWMEVCLGWPSMALARAKDLLILGGLAVDNLTEEAFFHRAEAKLSRKESFW